MALNKKIETQFGPGEYVRLRSVRIEFDPNPEAPPEAVFITASVYGSEEVRRAGKEPMGQAGVAFFEFEREEAVTVPDTDQYPKELRGKETTVRRTVPIPKDVQKWISQIRAAAYERLKAADAFEDSKDV